MNKELHMFITSIVAEVLNIQLTRWILSNAIRFQSWDSLKHMELILRIEEEYRIRFTSREVAEIRSLDDLVRIIELKL